jgi:hypothetical protein
MKISTDRIDNVSEQFKNILLSVVNPIAEQTKYMNKKNKTSYLIHPIDFSATNKTQIKKINQTIHYYKMLRSGCFSRYASYITEEHAKKQKIPTSLLNGKKWTNEEIEAGLKNVVLEYLPGYYPSDKSILPKHLSEIFYNPYNHNCKSLFLKLFANKPRKIDCNDCVCKDEEDYNAFRRLFEEDVFGYDLTVSEENELKGIVNQLIDEYEEIMKNGFECIDENEASYNIGTRRSFFSNYLEWLTDRQKWLKKKKGGAIKICQIKPFTKTWNSFADHMRQEHGIRIYT